MKRFIAALAIAASLTMPLTAAADTQLTVVGSSALLPLVKQSATEYQAAHSDVRVSVSGGGSFVGIAQAASGQANIGDSDVVAPGNAGLSDHKVAVVGFGVVVNPSAGVTGLSAKQIRDIFSGRTTNWNQVGGRDQQIVVINRPRSSGTRAVFKSTMMGVSKITESGLTEDSSGQVVTTVASTPGTVTYVALGYTKNKPVTVLRVNNVEPTENNIRQGRYPIWSYEHMFTKGRATGAAADFIRFVQGNRNAIEKLGFIQISSMKVRENNR